MDVDTKADAMVSFELIGVSHTRPYTRTVEETRNKFELLAGDPTLTVMYLRLPNGKVIAAEPKGRLVMEEIAACLKPGAALKAADEGRVVVNTTNQESNDGSGEQNSG